MKTGWNMLGLSIAAGCAAVYTVIHMNVTSIFLLLFTGSLLLLAVAVKLLALNHVDIERIVQRAHFVEGESIRVRVHIRHVSYIPLFWMAVYERWENAVNGQEWVNRKLFFPLWRKNVSYAYELCHISRGIIDARSVEIVTGDLVGSMLKRKMVSTHDHVVVYPRPLDVKRLVWKAAGEGAKLLYRLLQPRDMMLQQIRDYRQGDSLRKIHWKSTAKTGSFKTKQEEDTRASKLMIVLDAAQHAYSQDRSHCFEEAVRAAAGLLQYAFQESMQVQLVSTDSRYSAAALEQGVGLHAGYEQLSRLQADGKRAISEVVHDLLPQAAGQLMIVLTPNAQDELLHVMKGAASRQAGVFLLSEFSVPTIDDRKNLRRISDAGIPCSVIPCRAASAEIPYIREAAEVG